MNNLITEETFITKTGEKPIDDDLERCNCSEAGKCGHNFCGWCEVHDLPRFMCGCVLEKPE